MLLTTSFGQIEFISENIIEIIIKQNIEITLESMDEYENLMSKYVSGNYAVLVNRINRYSFTFEATLCVGSAENLKAAAIISYDNNNEPHTENLKSIRHMDNLNIKEFSGLELGREKAIKWLEDQLVTINKNQKAQ